MYSGQATREMAQVENNNGVEGDITYEVGGALPCDVDCEIPEGDHEIFVSVRYNHIDGIQRQIRQGTDINIRHTGSPCTLSHQSLLRNLRLINYAPLHVAVLHSHLDTVKLLVDSGADINIRDGNNRTPLIFATLAARVDVVKYLIAIGADVNCQSSSMKTALICALINKELVKLLLSAGSDLDVTEIHGGTALFTACMFRPGDPQVVQLLVSGGCDINKPNGHGASPLMMAVQAHGRGAVSILLKAGANVNQLDKDGRAPIHAAAEGGNRCKDIALLLIQHGADVNVADKKGSLPLDRALGSGRVEMIELCLLAESDYVYEKLYSERMMRIYNHELYKGFKQWLDQEIHQPTTLRRLCRKSIRKSLGPEHLKDVTQLQLPREMTDFIGLKSRELSAHFNLGRATLPLQYAPMFLRI